uniref:Uncharacterized protein n=1 Tax=Siphoviridae sp. cttma3 TaxID=2825708 RepID=A0A8S5V8L1_9CAUD|nr:MAG TPA: hypothetical protein [Siphoviridae sp. cttma3]
MSCSPGRKKHWITRDIRPENFSSIKAQRFLIVLIILIR